MYYVINQFHYYWSSSFMIALQFFLQLVNMLFKYHLYALRLTDPSVVWLFVCSAKSWTVVKIYWMHSKSVSIISIISIYKETILPESMQWFPNRTKWGLTGLIRYLVYSDFGTCFEKIHINLAWNWMYIKPLNIFL